MEQILLTLSYVEQEEFQKGGKLYFWPTKSLQLQSITVFVRKKG